MPLHSVVVEAASTFPCAPRVRLPPASTGCCDSPLVGPCIPPGSLAPRGARCRPPRRRRARDGPIVTCARRCIRRSTCPADARSKTATAALPLPRRPRRAELEVTLGQTVQSTAQATTDPPPSCAGQTAAGWRSRSARPEPRTRGCLTSIVPEVNDSLRRRFPYPLRWPLGAHPAGPDARNELVPVRA